MGWLTSALLTAIFGLIYFALADLRAPKAPAPDEGWDLDPVRKTPEQRMREAGE